MENKKFLTKKAKRKNGVFRYLALGFIVLILVGSGLLALPIATQSGTPARYLDALFTSASATCVTGLTPFETGAYWSYFGQIVILFLIQLGGLGFMAFVSILILMFRKKLGLYTKTAIMETMGGYDLLNVKKVVQWVFLGTFLIEGLGACLLMIRFIPDFGAKKGIYYSVWHSVSAFCNAGFDVFGAFGGSEPSLLHYATDPLVSIVIPLLIILGGLGFCVWYDLIKCRFNLKKCHLYTKLMLICTAVILLLSTVLFAVFERNNPQYAGYSAGEKILCAFFQAATTRTAGFYTTSPATFSASGYLLTVVLMFIGGCSGSTAGGIKVSTFAVIIVGMAAVFRGKRDIDIGKKRVDSSLLGRALAIFICYLLLVIAATLVICAVEPNGEDTFRKVLYEVVSALGTVGLSMGVTSTLGVASKLILIVLMYAGRVGVLTLAFALGRKRGEAEVRKPLSTLFIG